MHLRLILPAALACAVLTPASASAGVRIYEVVAEGGGSYDHEHRARDGAGSGIEGASSASFDWRVRFPRVTVTSDGAIVPADAGETIVTADGAAARRGYDHRGVEVASGHCAAGRAVVPAGVGRITAAPAAAVVLRPFERIELPALCTGLLGAFDSFPVWTGDPAAAFDHRFTLPRAALAQKRIIQHVSSSGGACPGRFEYTTACALVWSGKVTFDLVSELPDVPKDAPAPIEPLVPEDPDELIAPLRDAVLGRTAASVRVRCAAACTGTVTVMPRGGSAKRLGRASFRLRAAGNKRVRVPLGKSARRAATRARGVKIVVAGGGQRLTATVRARG